MGPASGGLQALTLRRKAKMGVGYSGTPWSGQAMNWNCLSSRFSLEPFCMNKVGRRSLSELKMWNLLYGEEKASNFLPCKGQRCAHCRLPTQQRQAWSLGSFRKSLCHEWASTGHTSPVLERSKFCLMNTSIKKSTTILSSQH